ncbi:MAG: hypothetical protein H0W51_01780 [Euzebyales bacterium]|nr:hypothetical protein [Euzebyales bacterium]
MRRLLLAGIVVLLAGCADDGAAIRTLTDGGSAAGSGSAGGSVAASGSVPADCEPVGDPASADTTVATTLDEWSITAEPDEVPAGTITFDITNAGAEPHELVVVRAANPADLPVANGAVDEASLPDGALIGEVEGFPGGETCSGTFELAAGDYVLFCTIVETEADGTIESHFEEGMVSEFTVSS